MLLKEAFHELVKYLLQLACTKIGQIEKEENYPFMDCVLLKSMAGLLFLLFLTSVSAGINRNQQ